MNDAPHTSKISNKLQQSAGHGSASDMGLHRTLRALDSTGPYNQARPCPAPPAVLIHLPVLSAAPSALLQTRQMHRAEGARAALAALE